MAGCFLAQPDFFSQRLQSLLQIYAYLLSLAFETEAFYPPDRIRLRLMPEEPIQRRHIATFQDRVLISLQQDISLARAQAELLVWQQLEAALLAEPIDTHQQRRP